jgi:hypothetical protein
VKVKTIWGPGIVSVATPYIQKAIKNKEDLEIEVKGAVMKVKFTDLIDKKPREASFNDRFGRKKEYSLYDFFWKTSNA